MEPLSTDVAEEVLLALAEPNGTVLVCMRSAEETADVVVFLRKNGFVAKSTATAQEMLERAIAQPPDVLVVASETAVIGISDIVTRVSSFRHWPDSLRPGIIMVSPPAPPSSDIMIGYHTGPDMRMTHPVNKNELLMFLMRIIEAMNSSDGRYNL